LGNLRRLSATDLRQVVKTIGDDRKTRLTSTPLADEIESANANASPPIGESARAN
jgi:hypothetical protein